MSRFTFKKPIILKLSFGEWLLSLMISYILLSSTGSQSVFAKEAEPMANDVQVEARLVHIAEELRCLVCQNESLSSSHADLAEDLRTQVREQIVSGKTDQEIKDYLVERYGDFVLYRPVVKPMTWLLWFGPFAGLLIAVFVLGSAIKRRNEKIREKGALLGIHLEKDPVSREPGLDDPIQPEPGQQPGATAHSKA